MNTAIKYASLQAMLAANLDADNNGHGRPLTDYTMRVEVGPTDGVVELHVFPTGFDFKLQRFGISGNALMSEEQLDNYRTAMANEKRAQLETAATQEEARAAIDRSAPPPIIAEGADGESVAQPTLGGAQ